MSPVECTLLVFPGAAVTSVTNLRCSRILFRIRLNVLKLIRAGAGAVTLIKEGSSVSGRTQPFIET